MKNHKYAVDICETAHVGTNHFYLRYRSENAGNPVLLFLHGGPGSCDRPLVIKYLSPLADAFTLVCWDQRGAGKAYDPKAVKTDKITIDTCVEDAHAVIGYLKERFSRDKIYVVGHSWGSILGVLLAQRYPEDIAAYVGIGQFVFGEENERLSYEFTLEEAQRRDDKSAVRTLKRMGAPAGGRYARDKDLIAQRNCLQKYGGAMHNAKESILRFMLRVVFTTSEYTLFDYIRYLKGNAYCRRELYGEMIRVNFFESVRSLEVPVILTQGRHDRNTASSIAKRWFEALAAPEKQFVWFEESAHSPDFEEPELWMQTIRTLLKGKQAWPSETLNYYTGSS